MTTTEENILIVEFMGYKLTPCNNGLAWDIGKSIPSHEHLFPIQGVLHTGNELKFHTSWKWLMPVVEKIKDMGYDQELDKIDNVLTCNLRKENLCNAVVEFIKYYNLNK